MDKRHIIVSIIVAGLMAFVLCSIKASKKPQVINEGFSGESDMAWVADPFDSIYAQAIVPQLLDRILTDGDWWERRYFSSLSLRAKYSNGRFVTYQMATNENRNGAHGYYTLQMVSFDPVHSRAIDWNYIFKPGSAGQVVKMLEHIAEVDPEYMSWNANIYRYTYHISEGWYDAEESLLPNPTLTDEGVVFSYQPYEIACFATGMYHFTLPYNRVKEYLTDEARWCLGME